MHIKIISVGKLKEKYLKQGIAEYAKRLSGFCKLDLVEVPDEKAPEKLSEAQMDIVKEKEGERILSKIKDDEYVIILAILGKQMTSEALAKKIDQLALSGKSKITFVIGGSLGLADSVIKRSNQQLSFSQFTFPHQLMRLILIEQIYRSFKINHHEPYHK